MTASLKMTHYGFKLHRIFLIPCLIACLCACNQSEPTSYQGYVEGENIYLASPYSGILEQLAVQRGQHVTKDQLLFQLDPDPERLRVEQSASDLQQAKHQLQDLIQPRRKPEIELIQAQIAQVDANLTLAKIRVSRNEQLYKKNATDKDTLDEAVATMQAQQKQKEQYLADLKLAQMGDRDERILAQKAQVKTAEEKLADATWQLQQKTIKAPADGIIFDTYFRQDEFVASQQPVLSLLTPDNVRIEFFVPVTDLSKLKLGQTITFQCYGCETTSEARVSYISPEAQYIPPLVYSRENTEKLVFRIKAQLSTFNQYKPGQPVTVFLKDAS